MKQIFETKEARQERQLKNWRKLVKEMKESVAESYHRKVQHDAYYINFSNIVERCV